MAGDLLEFDAPPDVSLLADAVEKLEALFPDDVAIEELVHLARNRALVERELCRRNALRLVAEIRSANAGASERTIAKLTARRLGETSERVRAWVRTAGDSTHDVRDAHIRKEPP